VARGDSVAGARQAAVPGPRVGVDIAMVEDVARSIGRFGDRYRRRVFTDHELECAGHGEAAAARLAARFAAKEAVLKVLRVTGAQPDWRTIEVHRMPAGWCEIRLAGEAARQAERAGLMSFAVSLTHEGGIAGAVVVALEGGGGP
jgi:holo-[acyl-carrier protein] synthase